MPDIFKIDNSLNINTSNIILGIPGTGYQYISSSNLNTGNNHTFNIVNPIGSGLTINRGKLVISPSNLVNSIESEQIAIPKYGTYMPEDVKLAPMTIPALSGGGVRTVCQSNLGLLNNRSSAVLVFYSGELSYDIIKQCRYTSGNSNSKTILQSGLVYIERAGGNTDAAAAYDLKYVPNNLIISDVADMSSEVCMMIRKNYLYSHRFYNISSLIKFGGSTGIGYTGIGATTAYEPFFRYFEIPYTGLFGWQSTGLGVFGIPRQVEMQGAWLEDSGAYTIANFALVNYSPIASNLVNLTVRIYA